MKCKRIDELHIIGDRRYFTYEMSSSYENRYYNSTPTERIIYVFSATTKDTGLEKYL